VENAFKPCSAGRLDPAVPAQHAAPTIIGTCINCASGSFGATLALILMGALWRAQSAESWSLLKPEQRQANPADHEE